MSKKEIREPEKINEKKGATENNIECKEHKFGIKIKPKPTSIILSAIILAGVFAVLSFNPQLISVEHSEEVFRIDFLEVLFYALLALAPCALAFLEIKLPDTFRAAAGGGMLAILPLLAFFAVDLINETYILSFSFETGLANYMSYLMIFALVYAVSRRVWITAAAGGAVFLIFGIANYFTVAFRGEPVLPWDLQTIGTAAAVMGNYTYNVSKAMLVSVLIYAVIVLFCFRICPRGLGKTRRSTRIAQRASAVVISAALFVMIFPMDIMTNLGISVWAWNQKISSRYTGITAGFFANIQFLMVDKPEGYSREKVEELAKQISELPEPEALGTPSKTPTIITIMNESLTDLEKTGHGSVSFEPDNLPYIHSLQESGEVVWGTAYSSVYGGNTCNSEYEFLTGNSLAFLPTGSKPYQQYVNSEQTAIVSTLDSYGYDCIAVHPGDRSAWQRDTAYPFFGFDRFVDALSFDVRRVAEHKLTSDASNYDQLIYEYEHREKDNPLFLFNVTIQNHGGYTLVDYPTTVRVAQAAGEYSEAEQYLSLTRKSDEAYKNLLSYFSKQEDPVVVLMFGDHWPSLETDFLSALFEKDSENLSFEDMMREYEVPFVIWANYPIKGQEIERISVNYLSGLLLRCAGIQSTEYLKYLENVRETLPVLTANGMIDKEGKLYEVGKESPYDELLNDYAILQYNNAFGEEEKAEELFLPAGH